MYEQLRLAASDHDVWQCSISRLVQAEVGRHDSRQLDVHRFQPSVYLTCHRQTSVSLL